MAYLWCALLGPVYFLYKGNWFMAFLWLPVCFFIALVAFFLLLMPLFIPFYAIFAVFLIPQIIWAFFVKKINYRNYKNRGWTELF